MPGVEVEVEKAVCARQLRRDTAAKALPTQDLGGDLQAALKAKVPMFVGGGGGGEGGRADGDGGLGRAAALREQTG